MRRVAGGTVCQVCGLLLDARAIAFVVLVDHAPTSPPPGGSLPDDLGIHALDHGLMHRACARLALRWCPELKRRLAADELVAFDVPTGSIEAFGPDAIRAAIGDL